MSTTIDINVTPTVQDVTINTVDNITVINVNTQSGGGGIESIVAGTNITVDNTDPLNPIVSSTGGGGSQTLAETLLQGNTTGGTNISISEGDAVVLDNGSFLSKGVVDAGTGGNKGIALTCAVGYEWKWESGEGYLTNISGNYIDAKIYARAIPLENDDETKGFTSGSYWYTLGGTKYVCTDATEDNAVWVQEIFIPTLQEVMEAGKIYNQTIGDYTFTFQLEETSSGIAVQNNITGENMNLGFTFGNNIQLERISGSLTEKIIFDDSEILISIINGISENNLKIPKRSLLSGNTSFLMPDNKTAGTYTVATTDDIPNIDATPTDGSNNAVSSNGVFDALATKENTITAGTTSQYYRGDKTFQTLDKTAVGLGNVDNTSDANKPISTATQTALNAKQDNLFDFNTRQGFYLFDDFIGNPATSNFGSFGISTAIQGAGATCLPNTTYPNRTNQQGVMQLGTGTTATGFSIVRVGDNNAGAHYLGNGVYTMQFFANIETLSDATNRFFNFFGATATNNLLSTNVIAFIYDEGTAIYGASSPNWKCVTRVGTTATLTTTTVPIVAGQWFVLRIVVNANASSVEFFINNVSVATHTTNIPTLITPRAAMAKTVGTTNRNAYLDYMLVQQIYTTPR